MSYIATGTIAYAEVKEWTDQAHIFDSVEEDALWNEIDRFALEGITLINADHAIETLEEKKEPLTKSEQQLLDMCKEARNMGADDLSVY